MTLRLTRTLVDQLRSFAEAAAPRECCGLLIAAADGALDAVKTANVAADPLNRFEIDPATLIAAHRAEREGRGTIAGYFHSHPDGNPVPSATDAAAAAADGRIWLIVGRGGAIAAWRAVAAGAVHGRFDPVALALVA